MDETSKALIYCRVSSKKQELEGSGLTSQEKRCKDYATSNGYTIEYVFHDTYSGGGNFMKRPAMKNLLDYADRHSETSYTVIFDDMKRFARDTIFHLKLRQEFSLRKLTPKCLNFNFDDSPEGEFIETILAAQGQLEREQNKRQVIQKMRARLMQGIYSIGGIPPYGYQYIKSSQYGGKILAIHPDEAHIVKEALEGFANGKFFHMSDVINYIKKSGLKRGKVGMCTDTVKSMMTNILYTGFLEFPKWNVIRTKGIHEAIITLETFEQIQERLLGKIPKRNRKDIRLDFPLRGLVLCAHCKKPLTASWSTGRSQKYPFYRCKHTRCSFANKSIRKEIIEGNFVEILMKLSPTDIYIKNAELVIYDAIQKRLAIQLKRRKNLEDMLINTKRLINDISDKLLIAHDPIIIALYEKKIAENYKKQQLIENTLANSDSPILPKLEPIVEKAMEIIKSPYKFWEREGFENRRLLIQTLFSGKLEYDTTIGFGTAEQCYILRFFEENEAFFLQDSYKVRKLLKTWNPNSEIPFHPVLDIVVNNWDQIINCLVHIAHLNSNYKKPI